MRILFGIAVVALIAILRPEPAAAEPKIGVASAARNQVQGIMGGGSRTLSAGSDVFSNEVVRTGDDSLAQLLFLDATSLSVGARSEVKLDRFVYNPERKTGNVVLEAGRGAFRFVSGSQNPTNYTIKTPLATIGVRGTIFSGVMHEDPYRRVVISEDLYVTEGLIVVQTAWGTYVLNAGQGLHIAANGSTQQVHWDLTNDAWEDVHYPFPSPEDRDLREQLRDKGFESLPLPPPCIPDGARTRGGAVVFCPPPGGG